MKEKIKIDGEVIVALQKGGYKMAKVGGRVGVIIGASGNTKTVEFCGYGVYVGKCVPYEAVGFLADIAKEAGMENPKIELDNGEIV